MTLTNANVLSKSIFTIFLICCLLSLSCDSFANDKSAKVSIKTWPWGASFDGLRHVYPGMIRTFSGLDSFQRTRIARFLRDDEFLGFKTRVYYSFKSNRLYEIQYDFKVSDREKFTAVLKVLADNYGEPKSKKLEKKPGGEIFTERSFHDYVWKTKRSKINLRWTNNVFKDRPAVNSMFITFREIESKTDKPRQTMSDVELEKSKAVTIAFTGAFSFGKNVLKAATDSGSAENRFEYPFVKLKDNFKEVKYFFGIIEKLSGTDDEYKGWSKVLKSNKFVGISVFSKENGTFEVLNSNAEKVLEQNNINVRYPYRISDGIKHVSRDVSGLRFGFFSYIVKSREHENELLKRIKSHLGEFKNSGGEIPVVFLYWNNLKNECKTPDDMLFAQSIIESGAYLVIGYNPNGLMPIQEHKNGLIIYSPGKLLPSNLDKNMIAESMIFLVSFVKKGIIGYDIVPAVSSSSAGNAYQVMLPDDRAKKEILKRFSGLDGKCQNRSNY